MQYIFVLLTFFLYSCSPVEVALAEEATEGALIIEKDFLAPSAK